MLALSLAGAGATTAVLLAMVFWWAGFAKVRTRDRVVVELDALGIRSPEVVARVLPLAEVLTSILLVVVPWIGATLAIGLLVTFTVVLIRVVRSGAVLSCACFGATSQRPVSWVDVARNVGLIAAAAVALAAEPGHNGITELSVPVGAFVMGALVLRILRERIRSA